MIRSIVPGLLLTALLASAAPARADVIPPDVDACSGKKAGDACTIMGGGSGNCAASKCSRIDYGSWDRDAMSSPPTVEYDCVKCVSGGVPADSGAPADSGTTPAAKDDGGCTYGVARRAGPFALAAIPAVVLAVLGRRRKRA